MLPLVTIPRRPDHLSHAEWMRQYKARRNKIIDRGRRAQLARPMTREAELAAIAAFIAEHGVRRVTLRRDGSMRIRTVRL